MSKERIIIITQNTLLLEYLIGKYNIVGVVESAPRYYKKFKTKFNRFLIKFYYVLKNIKNIKRLTKQSNIPYFFHYKNENELEKWIKDKEPDVIIVYSMSQLLKENIFNLPKYGTINFHPSILPKYRGPNPDLWVYEGLEKESGVTLHYIDKGEDTGDIIDIEKFDVPLGMNISDYKENIKNSISNLINRNFKNLSSLKREKQPLKSPTKRARLLKQNEISNYIDWKNWNTLKIWHLLKGLNSQYCFVNKKYNFINYEIVKHNESYGKISEGKIYTIDGIINYK